jgi:hypothetical protein
MLQGPGLTCAMGRMWRRSSSANQRGSLSSWKAYLHNNTNISNMKFSILKRFAT